MTSLNAPPVAPTAPRQLRMHRPHLHDLPPPAPHPGYRLRTYRSRDEAAWGEIMSSEAGIGTDWTPDRVRERLTGREQFAPDCLFFATCDAEADRPVASACGWRADVSETHSGILHMVCALPDHRGHGLGRLVSLASLAYLRQQGFSDVFLSTDDSRLAAIKSYLAIGFVPLYPEDAVSDHRERWSAIFTLLAAPRPPQTPVAARRTSAD